jgi:hypothetical protein
LPRYTITIEDIRQSAKDQFGPMAKHRIEPSAAFGEGESKESDACDGVTDGEQAEGTEV